jgi:hypothetical protein
MIGGSISMAWRIMTMDEARDLSEAAFEIS